MAIVALGVWLWGCCAGKDLTGVTGRHWKSPNTGSNQGQADVPTASLPNPRAALTSFPNYCSLALPLGHNHRYNK